MATDLLLIFSKIDPILSANLQPNAIKYGTAGFRAIADTLDFVLYRMGLLAVLRSKSLNGRVIGLMITASHNPEQDNGVKLVDPKGEMLEQSWETIATRVANAETPELSEELQQLVKELKIDWNQTANVFVGRDTRPSSGRLADHAISAIKAIGGNYVDCGIVTTPMLHFFVAEANKINSVVPLDDNAYYSKLASAFLRLNDTVGISCDGYGNMILSSIQVPSGNYTNNVHFDGANGVGAGAMRQLATKIKPTLNVEIFNNGTGRLNYMCGSDFVKVNMRVPDGVPVESHVRCVAVDGDADRLIYFYLDQTRSIHILDGDRIAILLASYLMELLRDSQLLQLKLGLVQTAYANGNATRYISEILKVPLACTETGVKYLHHKAQEFDIGVYFEANGHGTVVYSQTAIEMVQKTAESGNSAAKRLRDFMELTNQAVGDALSDFLLVETVLKAKGWDAKDWEASYVDLPSRLLKVSIKNRDVVTTTDAARRCVTPAGLQEKIDQLVANYPNGRSFVRSSGTEDVVRVYSEAATQAQADELGIKVSQAVFDLADGVGQRPSEIA